MHRPIALVAVDLVAIHTFDGGSLREIRNVVLGPDTLNDHGKGQMG